MTKRAHIHPHGSYVAEPSDADTLKLLGGGITHGAVTLTRDQVDVLAKFYGFDLEETDHPLIQAGNIRNLFRHAEVDGLRVMAFLAKHGFLDPGEDVVTCLAEAIDQSLFRRPPDIWNESAEESTEEDRAEA